MTPCPCCDEPRRPTTFFPDPPYGHTPMTIFYRCPNCSAEWEQNWCSAADDECPDCHENVEPLTWREWDGDTP